MTQRIIFKDRRAEDIKPGHVTIDGIVLDVQHGEQVSIRHRNVTYVQEPGSNVQVFGRVPGHVVEAIKEAMRSGPQQPAYDPSIDPVAQQHNASVATRPMGRPPGF